MPKISVRIEDEQWEQVTAALSTDKPSEVIRLVMEHFLRQSEQEDASSPAPSPSDTRQAMTIEDYWKLTDGE